MSSGVLPLLQIFLTLEPNDCKGNGEFGALVIHEQE